MCNRFKVAMLSLKHPGFSAVAHCREDSLELNSSDILQRNRREARESARYLSQHSKGKADNGGPSVGLNRQKFQSSNIVIVKDCKRIYTYNE